VISPDNERLAGLKRQLHAVIASEPPDLGCAALAVVLTEAITRAPRTTRIDSAMIAACIRAAIITREAAPVVQ
jgi:hypothetical protein